MLTTVKGILINGRVELAEEPPKTNGPTEVIVTFYEADAMGLKSMTNDKNESKPIMDIKGIWKGKVVVPNDFDEPLDDLAEYM